MLADRAAEQVRAMWEEFSALMERMAEQESEAMAAAEALRESLRELAARQGALREDLRDQAGGSRDLAEQWREVSEQARRVGDAAARARDGTPPTGQGFHQDQRLGEVEARARAVGADASVGDLEGAADRAEELRRSIRDAQRAGADTDAVKREGAALDRMLDELQRNAARQAAAGERALDDLAQRQDGLGDDVSKAQDAAGRVSQDLRGAERALDSLERARDASQAASERLGEGRPLEADGRQGQAERRLLEALEQLEDAMDQASEGQVSQQRDAGDASGEQEASGATEGGTNGDGDTADIELPRPEWFVTPEEYRRALLEGMEGEIPEEYRALRKRYFEELVRQ